MATEVQRGPVRIEVTRDAWEEAQMELVARQVEAIALCDGLEPRLRRLYGMSLHVGPVAQQLAAGSLYDVRRFRARNEP